ncbi:hypothetical protein E2C01_076450 [Portunus trituberculatus]|uniref:Uncharacterized protein n=1 Tax=Portunus trituberculatus TaxID=210409 RepID=A0A5B7IHT8_PORTR|nr:hypothetical protein [Portunus trituberculatus]
MIFTVHHIPIVHICLIDTTIPLPLCVCVCVCVCVWERASQGPKKKKEKIKKKGPLECWVSKKWKSVSQIWGVNASIPPS